MSIFVLLVTDNHFLDSLYVTHGIYFDSFGYRIA